MADPARSQPLRMTKAEFLGWNDGSATRCELVGGVVRAMSPPSPAHSTIVGNVAGALHTRLKPPCRIRIEYGVDLEWSENDCFQADLTVVCGDVRRGEPLPDPVLIVEVSSRSSFDHDHGRKSGDYKLIPGCRCLPVVESERCRVERWTRDGERWIVRDHIGEAGPVPVDGLDVVMDLAEVYAAVEI